jgi:hypothetical protein
LELVGGSASYSQQDLVYEFIKRLPEEFKLVKQKPRDENCLDTEDIGLLQHWYDCLERFITQIPAKNIYNFDETGFQLGQGKTQKVVTTRLIQAARGNPTREMGDLVTVVECIAADGFTMTPYFIFKGTVHLERWYDFDIPGEYHIAVSPKGYSTDTIGFDWIQAFDYHTRPRLLRRMSPGCYYLMDMDLILPMNSSNIAAKTISFPTVFPLIQHILSSRLMDSLFRSTNTFITKGIHT